MIAKAKRNYYNDLVLDNKNNSNKLWKIMHSLSNIKTKGQSPKKLHNDDGNVLLRLQRQTALKLPIAAK